MDRTAGEYVVFWAVCAYLSNKENLPIHNDALPFDNLIASGAFKCRVCFHHAEEHGQIKTLDVVTRRGSCRCLDPAQGCLILQRDFFGRRFNVVVGFNVVTHWSNPLSEWLLA